MRSHRERSSSRRRRPLPDYSATAVAAVIWASYAFFIGRLGGKAFEDRPWIGLGVAFGITVAVSAVIEAIRRIRGMITRTRASHRTG